jgi:hypothetical protein
MSHILMSEALVGRVNVSDMGAKNKLINQMVCIQKDDQTFKCELKTLILTYSSMVIVGNLNNEFPEWLYECLDKSVYITITTKQKKYEINRTLNLIKITINNEDMIWTIMGETL